MTFITACLLKTKTRTDESLVRLITDTRPSDYISGDGNGRLATNATQIGLQHVCRLVQSFDRSLFPIVSGALPNHNADGNRQCTQNVALPSFWMPAPKFTCLYSNTVIDLVHYEHKTTITRVKNRKLNAASND